MSDRDGDLGAIESFYGRWAALYDQLATRTPGIGAARERAVQALELSPGDTVVEMGCGTGANLPYLRERVGDAGRVVGVDLTPGMLARAQARIDRGGWTNVHVVRGDGRRPPIARADAALATFVVGMFDDPAVAVNRWSDLVGPGGRVASLDALPRDRGGVLDAVFRAFVALSAPPTLQVRYADSPARLLGERVDATRAVIAERGRLVADDRFGRGFLRLTAGQIE